MSFVKIKLLRKAIRTKKTKDAFYGILYFMVQSFIFVWK